MSIKQMVISVFQGDTSPTMKFGVRDSDGKLIDISTDYTCHLVAEGVDRAITDMDGVDSFVVTLNSDETALMTVGEQYAWVIIRNATVSPEFALRHRIRLNIIENEVAD